MPRMADAKPPQKGAVRSPSDAMAIGGGASGLRGIEGRWLRRADALGPRGPAGSPGGRDARQAHAAGAPPSSGWGQASKKVVPPCPVSHSRSTVTSRARCAADESPDYSRDVRDAPAKDPYHCDPNPKPGRHRSAGHSDRRQPPRHAGSAPTTGVVGACALGRTSPAPDGSAPAASVAQKPPRSAGILLRCLYRRQSRKIPIHSGGSAKTSGWASRCLSKRTGFGGHGLCCRVGTREGSREAPAGT